MLLVAGIGDWGGGMRSGVGGPIEYDWAGAGVLTIPPLRDPELCHCPEGWV